MITVKLYVYLNYGLVIIFTWGPDVYVQVTTGLARDERELLSKHLLKYTSAISRVFLFFSDQCQIANLVS
jgi:hypothetical protein